MKCIVLKLRERKLYKKHLKHKDLQVGRTAAFVLHQKLVSFFSCNGRLGQRRENVQLPSFCLSWEPVEISFYYRWSGKLMIV